MIYINSIIKDTKQFINYKKNISKQKKPPSGGLI